MNIDHILRFSTGSAKAKDAGCRHEAGTTGKRASGRAARFEAAEERQKSEVVHQR